MTKNDVVQFFGGTPEHVGIALGIQAASMRTWPDPLSPQLRDRVIGAGVRQRGVEATRKAFPKLIKR